MLLEDSTYSIVCERNGAIFEKFEKMNVFWVRILQKSIWATCEPFFELWEHGKKKCYSFVNLKSWFLDKKTSLTLNSEFEDISQDSNTFFPEAIILFCPIIPQVNFNL